MKKIIIYAPSYSDKVGGTIALHKLCHIINEIGGEAYLYPMFRSVVINKRAFGKAIWSIFKDWIRPLYKRYKVNPSFNTPVLKSLPKNINEYIVIYPEITFGNPLNAKNIVRWLLHNPGFHTNIIHFGTNEFYIKYHHGFDEFTHYKSFSSKNILQIKHYPTELYNLQNTSQKRSGTAYCLRKGVGKKIVHDLRDSILIDGKSHQEIAKIFKSVKCFISYDTNTAFSHLAVLCGCDSVVIPDENVTEENWYPNPKDRYGIAYGFENIEKSQTTKHMLDSEIKNIELTNIEQTKKFIDEINAYFGLDNISKKSSNSIFKKIRLKFEVSRKISLIKKFSKVDDIAPYLISNWHHGFAYFIGKLNGQKVFIKTADEFFYLCNDIAAEKILKDKILTPKVLEAISLDKFEMVVFEFIEGNTLNPHDLINHEGIPQQLILIINELNKVGLFHRDIKLNNFLVDKDKNVYIIDFTFSVSNNATLHLKELDKRNKEELKILNSIGEGYNQSYHQWNDKFSLNKILERIVDHQKLLGLENSALNQVYKYTIDLDPKFSYAYRPKSN
jgi:tRNA A-37 threonylcarbamoyl transferase component Bud32